MDTQFASQVEALARVYLIPTAWKLLGAVALWVVGSWLIKLVRGALNRFLHLRQLDATLVTYLEASAGILLGGLLALWRTRLPPPEPAHTVVSIERA